MVYRGKNIVNGKWIEEECYYSVQYENITEDLIIKKIHYYIKGKKDINPYKDGRMYMVDCEYEVVPESLEVK